MRLPAWLAGNPGPPPSRASVLLVCAVLGVGSAGFVVLTWPRRHFEKPLRKGMRHHQPVTWRADVDVRSARGMMNLIVYADGFEVTNSFPPARFLFGQQYAYRAADTTIEVVPGLLHNWIEIGARHQPGRQPPARAARIRLGRKHRLRQIWDALLRAGSVPIGPPPAESD